MQNHGGTSLASRATNATLKFVACLWLPIFLPAYDNYCRKVRYRLIPGAW
jgi:hypothetical protein